MATDVNPEHVEAIAPLLLNSDNTAMEEPYQKLNESLEPNGSKDSKIEQTTHIIHNKLGTINGCYVPCLLNIMGIILFERLGWGIGQLGVSGVLYVFVFIFIITLFLYFQLRFCDDNPCTISMLYIV